MGMTSLSQIGVLPALLIVLGGLLMLRRGGDDRVQRRFLLYLLAVAALLMLALLAAWLMTGQSNSPFWQVSSLLVPSITGVFVLLVLRARQLATMGRGVKVASLLLLLLGATGMVIGGLTGRFGIVLFVVVGVLVLVVGWTLGRRFRMTAVLLAILLLLALYGLNSFWSAPPGERTPLYEALGILLSIAIMVLPGLTVAGGAVLLTNALRAPAGASAGKRALWIVLALALLGSLATTIFWASVWDQTSDGLGGIFYVMLSAPAAVAAGMVMTVTLDGRRRVAGLLFTVLTPLLLYQSLEYGWDVSYHAITEGRAERITQALEDYRQREGVYPATLDALTPRYLLRIPQPVELKGETWCYQGGDEFYRLGAFAREYFSTPVELRVYQSAGEPDGVWGCEERLSDMKER